jgi:hypothetical protein
MLDNGESQKEAIRTDFNRAIMIDFLEATINSDCGSLLLREIDDHCWIIYPTKECLEDLRSHAHDKNPLAIKNATMQVISISV